LSLKQGEAAERDYSAPVAAAAERLGGADVLLLGDRTDDSCNTAAAAVLW
jgi:hypothetical protein